jgi:hypothetical protein
MEGGVKVALLDERQWCAACLLSLYPLNRLERDQLQPGWN